MKTLDEILPLLPKKFLLEYFEPDITVKVAIVLIGQPKGTILSVNDISRAILGEQLLKSRKRYPNRTKTIRNAIAYLRAEGWDIKNYYGKGYEFVSMPCP